MNESPIVMIAERNISRDQLKSGENKVVNEPPLNTHAPQVRLTSSSHKYVSQVRLTSSSHKFVSVATRLDGKIAVSSI